MFMRFGFGLGSKGQGRRRTAATPGVLAAGRGAFSLVASQTALLVGYLLSAGAGSFSLSGQSATLTKSSSGDAAETTAFLARANAVTTLDATHTAAYKALINGGVADGWFQKMDLLFIGATQSEGVALLNLPSATYDASTTVFFTADVGFDASGTFGSVATPFNPTTAVAPNYVQDSAHVSVWSLNTGQSNVQSADMGVTTGGANLFVRYTGDTFYARVQDQSAGFANTNASGLFVGNRSSSTARQAYRNAVSAGTYGSTPSGAVENKAFSFVGDPSAVSYNIVAAASVGGSLTPTDVTNYHDRLRTFLTTVGAPI